MSVRWSCLGKRGWTYHERIFEDAKEAWEFNLQAESPKETKVKFENGFQVTLSDKGKEEYFGKFNTNTATK